MHFLFTIRWLARKVWYVLKTSHGSSHRGIGDDLVSKMAKQCKLPTREFREL